MDDFQDVEADGAPGYDPAIPLFREWARLKEQRESLQVRETELKEACMSAVATRGWRDDKGNQYLDLPFPLDVGGKSWRGMKRELRTSFGWDEEVAEHICRAKGVYEDVFPLKRVFDPEELHRQYQMDALTDEDMDHIRTTREVWAFKGVT